MSKQRARIIAGEVFDAGERAREIVALAEAEAGDIRRLARAQGLRDAQGELDRLKRELSGLRTGAKVRGEGGHTGEGGPCAVITRMTGSMIGAHATRPDLQLGDVFDLDLVEQTAVASVAGAQRAPIDSERATAVQLVGFRERELVLMPLGHCAGVAAGASLHLRSHGVHVACSEQLLGRVLDGLGRPMDGRGPMAEGEWWPVQRLAPNPLQRPVIRTPLATGVRAIDGLLTLGRGQRVGLIAGSGVGKSSLLGRIARSADVDVCVIALIGERGREVREVIEERLDPAALARSVVVCATIDAPALVRVRAAQLATAIAEWFCERRGAHVLLLMDSVTRWARAQREVGLAAGELPVRHGYPPSVFSALPRLLERAGARPSGAISAMYSVLTDGERADDPIALEVRSMVDGHVVLSGARAASGRWPAIDVLGSISRVMNQVSSAHHQAAAAVIRRLLASYREHGDLLAMGAYRPGLDTVLDAAVSAMADIEAFVSDEGAQPYSTTVAQLLALAARCSSAL